ncbi:MAG: hypothetical protein AAFX44_20055 [Pseudomonadota bacterium]
MDAFVVRLIAYQIAALSASGRKRSDEEKISYAKSSISALLSGQFFIGLAILLLLAVSLVHQEVNLTKAHIVGGLGFAMVISSIPASWIISDVSTRHLSTIRKLAADTLVSPTKGAWWAIRRLMIVTVTPILAVSAAVVAIAIWEAS